MSEYSEKLKKECLKYWWILLILGILFFPSIIGLFLLGCGIAGLVMKIKQSKVKKKKIRRQSIKN